MVRTLLKQYTAQYWRWLPLLTHQRCYGDRRNSKVRCVSANTGFRLWTPRTPPDCWIPSFPSYVRLQRCLDATSTRVQSTEKFVSFALRASILYLSQYWTLSGQLRTSKRATYGRLNGASFFGCILQKTYIWRWKKAAYAPKDGSQTKHDRKLQPFPHAGTIMFVTINISGQFTETMSGNYHMVIMEDLYSKLTRTIATTEIKSMHLETILLDNWIILYEFPN